MSETTQFTFSQALARAVLGILGWRVVGSFPDLPKYVLVGAPHTTNWDFPFTMLWMFAGGVRFNWIAKASLFENPLGWVFRRLGGIPVWRERKANFVSQIVQAFEKASRLIIVISPEGTRSKTSYWKTGFYYMALGAKVPIVMGYIDYRLKEIGIGPTLHPSGDIHMDFTHLREFYASKTGLYPNKQGLIEVKPID
jgi:1-acyl-sn-glycerol-3-phosphate acyltransferase